MKTAQHQNCKLMPLSGRLGQRGTSVLEFALVLPLLLLLLLTIMQFSLLYNAGQVVQYAAHAAARSAIVYVPSDVPSDEGISDPSLQLTLSNESAKYATIKKAAALACVGISPRVSWLTSEWANNPFVSDIVGGVSGALESIPGIGDMSEYLDRYGYAQQMTRIHFQKYDAASGEYVDLESDGNQALHFTDPGEDISVMVEHEFYLAIPLGGLVAFGHRYPVAQFLDPSLDLSSISWLENWLPSSYWLPGFYHTIRARSTLPLQGETGRSS